MVLFKGQLSYGLLNIPIELNKLVDSKSKSSFFNYSNKQGGSLKQYYIDDEGNKFTSGQITHFKCKLIDKVFTKEEKSTMKLQNTKEIKVIGTVDPKEINPLFLKNSYLYQMTPQTIKDKGFIGLKPYNLIKTALFKLGKGLIGSIVMNNKEKHLLIYPYGQHLVTQWINYSNELRAFQSVPMNELKPEELSMVEQVINQGNNVSLDELKDKSNELLTELIEKKLNGEEIKVVEVVKEEETDFLSALKVMVAKK